MHEVGGKLAAVMTRMTKMKSKAIDAVASWRAPPSDRSAVKASVERLLGLGINDCEI
jgi:hypothetical protein